MTLPLLRDRYNNFIQDLIAQTLKGEIRSKEQVYEYLCAQLQPGTGEVFEQCLGEQISQVEAAIQNQDERQQSKALRQQRALKTLADVWQEWLRKNQATTTINAARDSTRCVDRFNR